MSGKQEAKQFFQKRDVFIIVGLLVLALAVWGIYTYAMGGGEPQGPYAEVYFRGEVIATLYLEENQVYSVPEHPTVQLEVRDNAVAFIHSDCPDQVCIHTGWLRRRGDFAACLPNDVLIWVEDEDTSSGTDVTAK